MRDWIQLQRAEAHLNGEEIYIQVSQIDTFSVNIIDRTQSLIRMNGKEFIVKESVETIKARIGIGDQL